MKKEKKDKWVIWYQLKFKEGRNTVIQKRESKKQFKKHPVFTTLACCSL